MLFHVVRLGLRVAGLTHNLCDRLAEGFSVEPRRRQMPFPGIAWSIQVYFHTTRVFIAVPFNLWQHKTSDPGKPSHRGLCPLEALLSQQIPHVFRLAIRLCRDPTLAQDLTQETMLKAVRKLDQLQSPDQLRVWLFRILANTWKDHVRAESRRGTEPLVSEPPAKSHSIESTANNREELSAALNAMNTLPEKQRAVLHLFAVEELSLKEIGEVLGMNPSTAKVNLFHARQAMKRKLPQFAAPNTTPAARSLH